MACEATPGGQPRGNFVVPLMAVAAEAPRSGFPVASPTDLPKSLSLPGPHICRQGGLKGDMFLDIHPTLNLCLKPGEEVVEEELE